MELRAALLLSVLSIALPAHAGQGDLYLDLGAVSLFQEAGRAPAMAGTMGFRYGFDPHADLSLGVDYGRFLVRGEPGQLELTGIGVASNFAFFPGAIQPVFGVHMGMTKVDKEWNPLVALEAQVLAALPRGFQGYASVAPGAWFGDRNSALWVKMGLGLRMRLTP